MPVALTRLDQRIRRSKRTGKLVAGGVFLMSLVFGGVLVQGLVVAQETGQPDLAHKAIRSLSCLAGLNLLSLYLTWRQHRLLDEARAEAVELVEGKGPE